MATLNKNTIKHKLALGFLLIIVLFVSFGIVALREVHILGNLTKMIYEHPLVVSNASLNAGIYMTEMHRSMKDVALSNSLDELNIAINVVNEHEQLVYRQLDVIRKKIIGTEGQDLEKRTRQLFADWRPIREEVVLLFRDGRRYEAALITKEKGADHVAKLEGKMFELTSYARKKADSFIQLAALSQSRVENISVILVLVGIVLSIFVALFTARRVLEVEGALLHERNQLQKALDEITTLRSILPLCSYCKKIRDDKGYWEQVDVYIHKHLQTDISHSVCPECAKEHYPYSELFDD